VYDADYSGECNPDSIRAYVYTKTTRGNPLDDIYEIDEYLVNGVDIYIYIYMKFARATALRVYGIG